MASSDLVGVGQGDVQPELWEEHSLKHTWFHVMRHQIVKEAIIKEVGPSGWAVYSIIKAHTDLKTGRAHPSQPTIAELSGMSVDTVKRSIDKLIEVGRLSIVGKLGRNLVYEVQEQVPIYKDGQHVSTAMMPYRPTEFQDQLDKLKRYVMTGLPPGNNITINFNVTVINQAAGSVVNIGVNDVNGKPFNEIVMDGQHIQAAKPAEQIEDTLADKLKKL